MVDCNGPFDGLQFTRTRSSLVFFLDLEFRSQKILNSKNSKFRLDPYANSKKICYSNSLFIFDLHESCILYRHN